MSDEPKKIYHLPFEQPSLIEATGIFVPLIVLGTIILGLSIWGCVYCFKKWKKKENEKKSSDTGVVLSK